MEQDNQAKVARRRSTKQAPVPQPGPVQASNEIFKGIGSATLALLSKLGLSSAFDLVLHLPLRYVDETRIYPIADAPLNQVVQIEATVVETDVQYRPRKALICKVRDGNGELTLRFLHFYGSQVKTLVPGTRLRVLGEVRSGFFGAEMIHPQYRIIREETPLSETLTPIYPTTAGLSQATLRKLIKKSLASCDLSDTLPPEILQGLNLSGFSESVKYLHDPPPDATLALLQERTHPAWRRLKFDELLAQQLSMRLHYQQRQRLHAPALRPPATLTQSFLESLPFALTDAQQKVMREIRHDLAQPHPMQRLLQGDVGCGKTIVAAFAALQAIENDFQSALMAPTEILAEQHFRKLSEWLCSLGVKTTWLTASLSKKDKQSALLEIADGSAQLIIGTHALFQDQVDFKRLGLAIIDEQHRFGVEQRLALRMKGEQPHQLMMSATPIPRTLSMSYYADLDVSVIDQLPPGRTPVTTKLIADSRRAEVVERVRDICVEGRQVYWVCPLIEESEKLQLQTALETYDTLKQTFPNLNVGLVHGRLKTVEKTTVMTAFQRGEIHLLVATTVIEVGVDVANASLMVIEHAERMGLSQLHQLRGRVGRGVSQSACILLFQNPLSETARARLKIIYEHTDGFEIARQDLLMRGPGEFLGARQSGVPLLRFADLNIDVDLLNTARHQADQLLSTHSAAAQLHLARWLTNRQEYWRV